MKKHNPLNTYNTVMNALFESISEKAEELYPHAKHSFLEITHSEAREAVAVVPTKDLSLNVIELMMEKDIEVIRGLTVKGDHYQERLAFNNSGLLKYCIHENSTALITKQENYAKEPAINLAKQAIFNMLNTNLAPQQQKSQPDREM